MNHGNLYVFFPSFKTKQSGLAFRESNIIDREKHQSQAKSLFGFDMVPQTIGFPSRTDYTILPNRHITILVALRWFLKFGNHMVHHLSHRHGKFKLSPILRHWIYIYIHNMSKCWLYISHSILMISLNHSYAHLNGSLYPSSPAQPPYPMARSNSPN